MKNGNIAREHLVPIALTLGCSVDELLVGHLLSTEERAARKWMTGKVDAEHLAPIASILDCPVDDIIIGCLVSQEDLEYLKKIHQLTPEQRGHLIAILEAMVQRSVNEP